jgi:hypothetical protein
MDFIEDIRVSEECAQTELGAKIDGSAVIWDAREISWVRITEFSPAQGDEAKIFLLIQRMFRHCKLNYSSHHLVHVVSCPTDGLSIRIIS